MTAASQQSALLREMRRIALESNPGALPLVELAAAASHVVVEEHPLGMLAVHFKLPTCAVRLHIWTPATASFRDELGQLHDHVWHLKSYVLRGVISHEVYDLVDDELGDEVWIHDYQLHALRPLGRRARVVSLRYEQIEAGRSYSLPAGVVHQTRPSASGTTTLVRATPSGRTQARIVGSRGRANGQDATRGSSTLDRAIQELQLQLR